MIKDKDSHRWTMQKVQSERDRRLQGSGSGECSIRLCTSLQREEGKEEAYSGLHVLLDTKEDEKDLYRLTGQRLS